MEGTPRSTLQHHRPFGDWSWGQPGVAGGAHAAASLGREPLPGLSGARPGQGRLLPGGPSSRAAAPGASCAAWGSRCGQRAQFACWVGPSRLTVSLTSRRSLLGQERRSGHRYGGRGVPGFECASVPTCPSRLALGVGAAGLGCCPEKLLPVPVSRATGRRAPRWGRLPGGCPPRPAETLNCHRQSQLPRDGQGCRGGRGEVAGAVGCRPPWSSFAASDGRVSAVGLVWGRWRRLNRGLGWGWCYLRSQ